MSVRLYRITHRDYAEDPFSGKGGLLASGRWHTKGELVCYASESLALATLEQIARVGTLARLMELIYVKAELESAAVSTVEELPTGWDELPPTSASQNLGDSWLAAKSSVALRVPPVILPKGFNYILNPTHPGFQEVLTIVESRRLELDPRVIERLRK